jgi:DNA-binding MarR family transcriptional regulator
VWFRFLRLQGRIRLSMAARLRDVGLSIPQCDVLTTLTEHEGVSQQELAKHLYVTKGNISGLIDRLEAANLVERRPIAGDRRSYSICLTEEGRAAAEAGIAIQRRFVADSFGRMTGDDLAALDALLGTLRDAVRASEAPAPPPRALVR